ncbi:MAG: hypothetical protein REI94_10865 [Moraxellaceae bacterium]|nr:hypothetical protein [Moraxellaceae bacterium]
MKPWMKISLIVTGIASLAAGAGLYFTAGLATTADEFFAAARRQDMPQARALLAHELRSKLDDDSLRALLRAQDMADVADTGWSSRAVEGSRGELVGTLESARGHSIPVRITLVKEESQWRIQHIGRDPAGIGATAAAPQAPLPGERASEEMVKLAIHEFTVSTSERSMARFHRNISRTWQGQYSVAQLDEAYRPLFEAGDLTVLNHHQPQIGAPRVDERGVLVLAGHYGLAKNRVDFEQRYVMEDGQWKLLAFALDITS